MTIENENIPQRLPRPEQLANLSPDQLVATIFRLAMEICVLRDRLHTHELLLERANILSGQDLNEFVPDQDITQQRNKTKMELIEGILKDLS